MQVLFVVFLKFNFNVVLL